jgi:hypothetical protein
MAALAGLALTSPFLPVPATGPMRSLSALSSHLPTLSYALAALFAAFAGMHGAQFLWLRRRAFVVSADGLTLEGAWRRTTWRWREILGIRVEIVDWTIAHLVSAGRTEKYFVLPARGREVLIDARVSNHWDLVAAIAQAIKPHLVAAQKQALAAGRRITFGSVAADNSGVHCGWRTLPWNDVARVTVTNGRLVIVPRRGGSILIETKRVLNLDLFLSLAGRLIAKQTSLRDEHARATHAGVPSHSF